MTIKYWRIPAVLGLAAVVLTAGADLRSAEYDEQYTLFLTAGVARPVWPDQPFAAGLVPTLQASQGSPGGSLAGIARDLRATDVHPPLYFWLAALWRRLAGSSLLALRLLSVLLSLTALAAVAAIARRTRIAAVPAMLLTLGCYGFAYTGTIARGFALAQALTLGGIALLLLAGAATAMSGPGTPRRLPALGAGLLLGAAVAANYLAGFIAGAGLAWLAWRRWRSPRVWGAAWLGAAAWLPLLLWFLAAQHASRDGQFPAFALLPGLARLARCGAAAVFGGLPLYLPPTAGWAAGGVLAGLLIAIAGATAWRWPGRPDGRSLLVLCAIGPPLGLLLLGLACDTTPIELRYLAFATPFVGLLLAAVLRPGERAVVLAIQALALAGMLSRPETMQPARAAARGAAALAADGVVLLPLGNDGVGIVGAFAHEAPPAMRLLVVAPDAMPAGIWARTAAFPRVTLALLEQDAASRAASAALRAAFSDSPCWQPAGGQGPVLMFVRRPAPGLACDRPSSP